MTAALIVCSVLSVQDSIDVIDYHLKGIFEDKTYMMGTRAPNGMGQSHPIPFGALMGTFCCEFHDGIL